MAYVGTPLDTTNAFQSLAGKRFSGDASTTGFTLDSSPNSTLDIEVFVENVRQDPNSAYTVSGTTLTFTSAPPSGANNIYVVHQAKSVGTIDVPSASVQSGSLNSAFFTGATDIGAAIADADLLLLDDGAGGTLRKTAASRIKTYIGDNTPAFMAVMGSDDTIANSTFTKATFDNEVFDTDSAFASNKFTVPAGEGGKYVIFGHILAYEIDDTNRVEGRIYKNGSNAGGSSTGSTTWRWYSGGANFQMDMGFNTILDLNATDYIELYVNQTNGDSQTLYRDTWLAGFKLNGV